MTQRLAPAITLVLVLFVGQLAPATAMAQAGEARLDIGLTTLEARTAMRQADRARAADLARGLVLDGLATDTPWLALAAAADIYFDANNPLEAMRLLSQVLEFSPETLEPVIGDLYVDLAGRQEKAEQAGNTTVALAAIDLRVRILDVVRLDGWRRAQKNLLFQAYFLHEQSGAYGKAAEALRAWHAAAPPDRAERAEIDQIASSMVGLTQISSYSDPLDVLLGRSAMALAWTEALDDPLDLRHGQALREHGLALGYLGRFEEAEAHLAEAAVLLGQSKEGRQEQYLPISDLASLAWEQGQMERARALFEEGDRAARTAGVKDKGLDPVINATNRAEFHIDAGDLEAARAQIDQARRVFDRAAAQGGLTWNQLFLEASLEETHARLLSAEGNRDEAIAAMGRAVDLARAYLPEDHRNLGLILSNAADLYLVEGEREAARATLVEAVEVQRRALPETAPDRLVTVSILAGVELLAGNQDAARALFDEVTAGYAAPVNRTVLPAAALEFERAAFLDLEDAPSDLDAAIRTIQWTHVTRAADALAQLEARLKLDDPALATILRARQDTLGQIAALNSRLVDASERAGDAGPLLVERDALTEALGAIEVDLRAADQDVTSLGQIAPLNLSEIQSLLVPGEVLVTFVLPSLRPDMLEGIDASTNRVVAITATDAVSARIDDPSRPSIGARVTAFRCSLAVADRTCGRDALGPVRGTFSLDAAQSEGGAYDTAAAEALYTTLFGGLDGVLEAADSLIIVPPPDLLGLPFAALVTGPGDGTTIPYLVRSHAVSVLPSIPSLRTLRAATSTDDMRPARVLGVGDPVIGQPRAIDCATHAATLRSANAGIEAVKVEDETGLVLADPAALRGLARLPDTACELGRILDRVGGDLLLAGDATEARIKAMDHAGDLAAYEYLVFATHGLVAGELGTTSPGLVLTPPRHASIDDDGFLTAGEIASLDLGARLVVLSACNTAAGESDAADGLSGLARAFFYAGAEGVLVTQWAVYSDAAVEISTGLFDAIEGRGATTAQALQAAMLGILDSPGADPFRQHPSYWAAFTLVGAG